MADLKVTATRTGIAELKTPLLVLQAFEKDRELEGELAELDALYGGAVGRVLKGGDFRGRKDEVLVLYAPESGVGIERLLLVGVGKREDYIVELQRRAVGIAVRRAEKMGLSEIALHLGHRIRLSEHLGGYYSALAATEAAVLAAWQFRELKTKRDDDEDEERPRGIASLTLVATSDAELDDYERAAQHGSVIGRAANLARELQTLPSNEATPTFLADTAKRIADAHGLELTVLDRAQMQKEGLHALLAVARGTDEEPRFIVLAYRGGEKGRKPLALVGKGITFDTGGISIKPAERMEDMKYDMSGAAAVLGALQGIAELKLDINVVGVVPATENMLSGRAVKPGDVIRTHAGRTVEVINTDAEGRLVLADALSYVQRFEPAAIVDAATLTGACVIALGHQAMGMMGNNGALLDQIRAAGQRVGERCWPLPLWDEYREQIESEIADVKNTGGRAAGPITAGWFLKEFVAETTPWVHLDIAGTAYREEPVPYLRKGATGAPTRLFIEWARKRAGH
jgi:leucyl aminopeptidase